MATFLVEPHGHPMVAWILRNTGPRVDRWKRRHARRRAAWTLAVVVLGILMLCR